MTIKHLKERIEQYKHSNLALPKKRIRHYRVTASIICMEIVAAVVTGFFIGYFLDNFFHTRYVFKIICLMFACVGSFVVLYKLVKN